MRLQEVPVALTAPTLSRSSLLVRSSSSVFASGATRRNFNVWSMRSKFVPTDSEPVEAMEGFLTMVGVEEEVSQI